MDYMNKYKIVTCNGGGVRGIISIRILERLNAVIPFIDSTDMWAGVSTGGLIAGSICFGLKPAEIKKMYLEECKNIFKDSVFDDVKDLFGIAGADYDIKNLESVLKKVFGSARLSDLKKTLLVTAFDLDNENPDPQKRSWVPLIMSNLSGKHYGNGLTIVEALCATAAAPIYFSDYNGRADGGIINSNCSTSAVCALLGASAEIPQREREDILLLNVGTGIPLRFIEGKNLDLGYAGWFKNIIPAMMDGDDYAADVQCRELLGGNYFRIAPVFPHGVDIKMDAADKMDYMLELADKVDITPALNWLDKKWNK